MPGRNSMCIGNQKGVSRLGSLAVSFPSQVVNEKIHINFRFFLFFLYYSHVLSKCFSIFENSSEKIGKIYFIFLFFLFAITGLLEGIMIIIIHQNVHEDMSNNTFSCKNWFFSKTQHFLLQNSTSVYVAHARNQRSTLLGDDARYHNLHENNETTWRSKKNPGFSIRANVGIRPFDRQYTSRYRFLISKSKIKIFPIGKEIVCAIVLALTSRIFSPKKTIFEKLWVTPFWISTLQLLISLV